MKKLFGLLMALTGVAANAQQTQNGRITGTIVSQGKSVSAAAVMLLRAKDSSVIKTGLSSENGKFEIIYLKKDTFLIKIESINYENYYTQKFYPENVIDFDIATVNLKPKSKDLASVTVATKKPFIEQKLDKTVINVDASPTNAGLNVLDILEKSPGVSVDKDGAISLKGKQGVMVLIDGRPTYLSGQDLANMLKNMPGGTLDQIEIMTNPPAKYDAAGNSGIINIKTKKTKVKGINGSVTLGYGQGIYPKSNNSFNLNYRTGKFNFFANAGHSYNKRFQNMYLTRNFRDTVTNQLSSSFDQTSLGKRKYNSFSYKVGADYFLSKKTTFGVVLNGYTDNGTELNDNTSLITNESNELETQTKAINKMDNSFKNIGINVNGRHQFDSTGRELTIDLDYINYTSNNKQELSSYFYDKFGIKKQPDELMKGNLPSDINIYSAKVDYTHPLKKGLKIEAGLKTSFVQTDNNALYQNWDGIKWEHDSTKSNQFKYTENINAAYLNTSKEFNKKWSAQLGLRFENTISKGNQITTNQKVNRSYSQLFPTVFIGYNLSEKNQFSLSYGRRIDRPDYGDMNPFYNFLDKYTYQLGNPFLRPQFSHSIELGHTYGGFLTTSLSYSKTTDIIQDVLHQIDSITTTYITKENIAKQRSISLSISAMIPITKFWKSNIYANVFNNKFNGLVNGKMLEIDGTTLQTNINNQFTFKKGWNAELSGFYRTKSVEGVLVARSMGAVNFAVSKNILKNKGTIKVGLRDAFYTQQFRGYSKYQNIDLTIHNKRDSRVVNLTFTYRFSKGANTQQRKRGGAGDEQNRVKGGSN